MAVRRGVVVEVVFGPTWRIFFRFTESPLYCKGLQIILLMSEFNYLSTGNWQSYGRRRTNFLRIHYGPNIPPLPNQKFCPWRSHFSLQTIHSPPPSFAQLHWISHRNRAHRTIKYKPALPPNTFPNHDKTCHRSSILHTTGFHKLFETLSAFEIVVYPRIINLLLGYGNSAGYSLL